MKHVELKTSALKAGVITRTLTMSYVSIKQGEVGQILVWDKDNEVHKWVFASKELAMKFIKSMKIKKKTR